MEASFSYSSLSKDQTSKFDLLSELLRRENLAYNLTRITEPKEIKLRHFCDSLATVDIIQRLAGKNSHPSIVDIGSGAGFPGLALAIAMPQVNVTSIEATGKKVSFQQLAAGQLALDNFEAIHGRAEELGQNPDHREKYDFAVSRAVANLAILSELCLPLVKPGGYFLAWKGQKAKEEISNAKEAIRILGAEISERIPYTLDANAQESDLQIIATKKTAPTPAKYPRRFKTIKQKPLL